MKRQTHGEKIIARILAKADTPRLLDVLVNRLNPSDLQSLMMEVYRQRAEQLTAADVLQKYESNRFVKPSDVPSQRLLRIDELAFSLLPEEFEVVELSPVCPLGTQSSIATVNQNKVLTTVRNTEVCADATNVLALECARRRRLNLKTPMPSGFKVKLCASHRVVRTQDFGQPTLFSHFRLLNLCTAGRDEGSFHFEIEALVEHIQFYLQFFGASREAGYRTGSIEVLLTAWQEEFLTTLETDIIEKLGEKYSNVTFTLNQNRVQGRGYYQTASFEISVLNPSETPFSLVDGGFTDWTQQLLSNRKERLLISGMGSERFVSCFG